MIGLQLNITTSKITDPGKFTVSLANGNGAIGHYETLIGAINALPALVEHQLQDLPMEQYQEAVRCARDAMPLDFPDCMSDADRAHVEALAKLRETAPY